MALNAYARALTDRVVDPIGRGLARLGATANWMTFFGMVLTIVGAGVVVSGHRLLGAVVIAASGLFDALDGAVARARGTSGPFGAFYDSVVDRISDVAIFGAIAWLVRDDPLLFTVAIVALGAGQLTSYIRAKAESLGWNATVGVIERAERVIIALVGIAVPPLLPVALVVLAAGGLITIGQRILAVLRQAREAEQEPA